MQTDDKETAEILNKVRQVTDFICSTKKYCKLIPEVRTNVAIALPNATRLDEIAGVDGRITIVRGMPKCAGPIIFGATNHTGRLVLTAKQFDPSISAVINIRYTPELIEKLSNTDLLLAEIDRTHQTKETSDTEDSSMSWIIKNIYEKHKKIPDIIWDVGEIGKEPMLRLFAKDSDKLLEKIKIILNLFD
ncbi:MAG: thiamine-phosphate synthase family protein [Promethearchaeota archaeon]